MLAAQQGGAGLIVYNRKEGRALGEVTKFMVYNARKRQEGQIDRQIDGRAGGRAGRAAAQADRCMDGWMGGWMDGWTQQNTHTATLGPSQPLHRSPYQEGGDSAQNYFKRTEMIAGVQDMRFQVSE